MTLPSGTEEKSTSRKKKEETNLRSVMIASTLAVPIGSPIGKGRNPEDPSSMNHDDILGAFFLDTSESPASLPPATMGNSSSSSHAPWQGKVEQCLEGMRRLLGDSPAQNPDSASQMPCARCRTTCNRPQPFPRGEEARKRLGLPTIKNESMPLMQRRFSTVPSRTLLKKPTRSRNT